jgi:hypothetical protein
MSLVDLWLSFDENQFDFIEEDFTYSSDLFWTCLFICRQQDCHSLPSVLISVPFGLIFPYRTMNWIEYPWWKRLFDISLESRKPEVTQIHQLWNIILIHQLSKDDWFKKLVKNPVQMNVISAWELGLDRTTICSDVMQSSKSYLVSILTVRKCFVMVFRALWTEYLQYFRNVVL